MKEFVPLITALLSMFAALWVGSQWQLSDGALLLTPILVGTAVYVLVSFFRSR
jgi:hypothetical protein